MPNPKGTGESVRGRPSCLHQPTRTRHLIGSVKLEGRPNNGALRNVGKFTTLDAKLLSALTNILTGDFARKVDTYKETEATNHRYVRGRQSPGTTYDA